MPHAPPGWEREQLVEAAQRRYHTDPLFHARAVMATNVVTTEPWVSEFRRGLTDLDPAAADVLDGAIRLAAVVATHTAELSAQTLSGAE